MSEQLSTTQRPSHADTARIVIVGGGFAGWLAALAFRDWADRSTGQGPIRVQLIRTPTLPPIGVGESATGLLANFLRYHHISDRQFIREARATFKLGLELFGWNSANDQFLAPIDNPDKMVGMDAAATSISQRCAIADGLRVEDAHLHGWLMRKSKVPAIASEWETELLGTHSWHFDARAAADCVEKVARARGVELIIGEVSSLKSRPDGGLAGLSLTDGRQICGNFFIDCTGQRRLFMDPRRPDWVSQATLVPVNRAVAGFRTQRSSLPPSTRAFAAPYGWIWEIPTGDRLGVGYVHQSSAADPDVAWTTLRKHAGPSLVAGPILSFEPGYRRRPWWSNTVAVGMAAGFCEPLQSTSLHLALMQVEWIVRSLNAVGLTPSSWIDEALAFNNFMAQFQDDLGQFIALHYSGGAFANDFWRDAAEAGRTTALHMSCFTRCKGLPSDRALQGISGGISPNLLLPIAGGLGLLDREAAAKSVDRRQRTAAVRARRLHQQYCSVALDHRTALALVAGEPSRAASENSDDVLGNVKELSK